MRQMLPPIVAALFHCFFQLVTALLRLPAALAVTPLGLVQFLFGFVDAPLALVIRISRPHRRGTTEHQ
jgi:hypothetical protein